MSAGARLDWNRIGACLQPLGVAADRLPRWSHTDSAEPLRQAAVLVPLIDRPGESPGLLMIRRADHLASHPGQVGFPGGAPEQGDADMLATALRETAEETGIGDAYITPLGQLGCVATSTGYSIHAFVARVREGYEVVPQADEVAEIFVVPAALALDRGSFGWRTLRLQGRRLRLPELEFEGRRVWGATAVLLWQLVRCLEKGRAA